MRMSETTSSRLVALRSHNMSFEQIVLETPEEVFTKKAYVRHMVLPDKAMQRLDALAKKTKMSKALLFERAIDYCYAQAVQTEEKFKQPAWRKSLGQAAKTKQKPGKSKR